jgi:hypothetical protein
MSTIARAEFIHLLTEFWGKYIEQFHKLSLPEQESFLHQQGYANLTGLLSHLVAWWQDGSQVIARMRLDPDVLNPDYDVDALNAAAVQRCALSSELEMATVYEQQRLVMLDLIADLSDAELADERINTRLYYEIVQHSIEHALP